MTHDRMLPIAIFYDGTYFQYVSNYYAYDHPLRRRISIDGLHQFVQREVAKLEGVEEHYARIVEAHYFRGRLPAVEAQERETLYGERVFEDILMRSGVTTHYLPLALAAAGGGEKGVDVWLALEAYEIARDKQFGVTVLLTGDGDYVPLVRKLHSLGTRVMLMGWDLERAGLEEAGQRGTPRVAVALLEEVTYPLEMGSIIEKARSHETSDNAGGSTPQEKHLIKQLFVTSSSSSTTLCSGDTSEAQEPPKDYSSDIIGPPDAGPESEERNNGLELGRIVDLNREKGFGFIRADNNEHGDLFFYKTSLKNAFFKDLQRYSAVKFRSSENDRGPCAEDISLL